jgi:hypothetical protein
MMNILLTNHFADSKIHGMEYRQYYLAREWVKLGHQVTIPAAGVELAVRSYVPVAYPQIHGEFIPGLTILDALFHLGKRTNDLLEYQAVEPTQVSVAEDEL